MAEYPLVTNAIPLYKSKPFIEIIIANIDAIEYPNIEILISDRHQYDDAIDILAEYFRDDTRVRILRATDQLTYAQHYNLLLSLGQGKYFRWMPHDDSYPQCALIRKVQILETHPQYILVNGPWHILDSSGNVESVHQPMKSPLGRWSFETPLFVAFDTLEAHAFKGLFRRSIAVDHEIWLFNTTKIIFPERCWEFAMSLKGEFYNDVDFAYFKRYSPASTSQTWRQDYRRVDIFYAWFYKFKYQWSLDRKPARVIAFLILMAPLTFRRLLLNEIPEPSRERIKKFPGKYLKRVIRQFLSRL